MQHCGETGHSYCMHPPISFEKQPHPTRSKLRKVRVRKQQTIPNFLFFFFFFFFCSDVFSMVIRSAEESDCVKQRHLLV